MSCLLGHLESQICDLGRRVVIAGNLLLPLPPRTFKDLTCFAWHIKRQVSDGGWGVFVYWTAWLFHSRAPHDLASYIIIVFDDKVDGAWAIKPTVFRLTSFFFGHLLHLRRMSCILDSFNQLIDLSARVKHENRHGFLIQHQWFLIQRSVLGRLWEAWSDVIYSTGLSN